jgi:hypothetical protein
MNITSLPSPLPPKEKEATRHFYASEENHYPSACPSFSYRPQYYERPNILKINKNNKPFEKNNRDEALRFLSQPSDSLLIVVYFPIHHS